MGDPLKRAAGRVDAGKVAQHGFQVRVVALSDDVNRGSSVRGGSYRHALDRLPAHQKTAKGAPAYSRFVNRRVGRRFAALAFSLDLTPNQVTFISSLFTFAAIAAIPFAGDSWLHGVAVTGSLLLGYALDSADGQLARLRGGGSPAGEWLDHVLDSVKTSTLHVAVLLHLARRDADDVHLLVPLLFVVVASVWFFTVILTGQLRERHAAAGSAPASAPAPLLRSLLALPTDYGVLCLVFLALGSTSLFLALYALLLAGYAVILAAALPTWYRELQALHRSPVPTGERS